MTNHPYAHVRAEHHERAHDLIRRTGHTIPKHATGGAVHHRAHELLKRTGHKVPSHPDAAADARMVAEGVHEHETAMHPGKPKTKLKLKAGGAVEGHAAHHHLGKRARGGHAGKGKHITNVIIAPQGGGARGAAAPMMPARQPMAAPARPAAPPPQMAPRPAAPPPAMQGPPGGAPPGMRPPGMMKRGGGVRKVQEVGVPSESLLQAKRGGNVKRRQVGGTTGTPASAGVPANPSQMTPQQVQQIAQMRQQGRMGGAGQAGGQGAQQQPTAQQMQQMAARRTMAQQQGGQGGLRPGGTPGTVQPPVGAGTAAQAPTQKRGGEVKVREHTRRARGGHVPHMEAGAGGGEGRIEKTHEYGSGRGFKPKELPLRNYSPP